MRLEAATEMELSATYASLKVRNFLVGHGVGLCDDGDEVDFQVELPHELNVDLLQTAHGGSENVSTQTESLRAMLLTHGRWAG